MTLLADFRARSSRSYHDLFVDLPAGLEPAPLPRALYED